jgi:hypothetical protein
MRIIAVLSAILLVAAGAASPHIGEANIQGGAAQ